MTLDQTSEIAVGGVPRTIVPARVVADGLYTIAHRAD
jgi:hypothetical protein